MKLSKKISCLVLVLLICVCLFVIPCFAKETFPLQLRENSWYSNSNFYYFAFDRTWFLYDPTPEPTFYETEWIGNESIKAKLASDGSLLIEKDKNIVAIKILYYYNTELLSVSNTGKYVGFCYIGPMEDQNIWVIIDTDTLEIRVIPLLEEEYSTGSIVWSDDDKFLAIDIFRAFALYDDAYDVFNPGLLVYDTEMKQTVHKYIVYGPVRSTWEVVTLQYPTVHYLDENNVLHIYNISTQSDEVQ